jgi:hypothetical protein
LFPRLLWPWQIKGQLWLKPMEINIKLQQPQKQHKLQFLRLLRLLPRVPDILLHSCGWYFLGEL